MVKYAVTYIYIYIYIYIFLAHMLMVLNTRISPNYTSHDILFCL